MGTRIELSVPVAIEWVTVQEEGKPPEVARVFDVLRGEQVFRYAEINNHSNVDISGWRVYYSIRPKTAMEEEVEDSEIVKQMLETKDWFAMTIQSIDSIAVYFPSESAKESHKSALFLALNTYCRAVNAVVMVPEAARIRLNKVKNPWSGEPENYVSLLMADPGNTKLNGFRFNGVNK